MKTVLLNLLQRPKPPSENFIKELLSRDENLRSDSDVALALLQWNGDYLKFLGSTLKNSNIFVYLACEKSGINALQHASKELRSDMAFIKFLIADQKSMNGWQYLSRHLDESIRFNSEHIREIVDLLQKEGHLTSTADRYEFGQSLSNIDKAYLNRY